MNKKLISLIAVVTVIYLASTLTIADNNSPVKRISIRRGAFIQSIIGGIPSCAEFRSNRMSIIQVCPITNVSLSYVIITAEKYYDNPIYTVPLKNAYEYFVVTGRRLDSSMFKKLILRFRVSNDWIRQNNETNVTLYKWEIDNWKKVNTTEIIKHDDYTYYKATIDRYYVLAIGPERTFRNITTINTTTSNSTITNQTGNLVIYHNVTEPGNQTTTTVNSSLPLIPLILILASVALVTTYRKKRYSNGELQ